MELPPLKYAQLLERSLHKLKSPITVIQEGLALVLDETCGPVNDEQKMFLKTAQINVDRLVRMLQDVHLYQELWVQDIPKTFTTEPIDTIINASIRDVSPYAEKWNCRFDVAPLLKETVDIHKDLFKIAVKKILVNAIQFAPSSTISVTSALTKGQISIAIKDTGIGIKKEYVREIFKPFMRFAETNVILEGGSGIGLSIAERILDAHSGNISVSSEYENGSIFTISVPIVHHIEEAQ